MKSNKILNIVLWVIIAVSAFLVVSLISNLSDNKTDPTMGAWINTNLTWVYILFITCVGALVLFGIFQMVTDKAAMKSGLVALVFMGVVGIIAYSLADSSIPQFHGVENFVANGLTTTACKWIGTTLYGTYILFFIAIIAMAASPILKLFR